MDRMSLHLITPSVPRIFFLSLEHKHRGGHSPIFCEHAAITLRCPPFQSPLSSVPVSLILSAAPPVPAFSSLRFSNSTCVLCHTLPTSLTSPPCPSLPLSLPSPSFPLSPSARGIVCLNMTPPAARAYKSSPPLLLSQSLRSPPTPPGASSRS